MVGFHMMSFWIIIGYSNTYPIEICKATNDTATVILGWFMCNLGEINSSQVVPFTKARGPIRLPGDDLWEVRLST